jgi:transposase InsO family protein
VGQVLHGSATTTHAIRAAIQRSTASLQALSERYGINPKTVAKWRRRTSLEDRPMGPKVPRSTVLSVDEETLVIEFRRRTLLPLDDCLYALQATIAADFLRRLLEHVPYRIHTVLTDNGFQFTEPRGGWRVGEIQEMLASRQRFRAHAFDYACAQHGIGHRLTKFNHPWTNGQVERMNRTIKEATVRRFFYATHASLRAHVATFLDAYNFAKRLKSLRGLTPFERICQLWTEQPTDSD